MDRPKLLILALLSIVSSTCAQNMTPTKSFVPTPGQGGLSGGAIAGIVIGVVGGTLGIIIGTCCFIRSVFSRVGLGVSAPVLNYSVDSPSFYSSYQQPEGDAPYHIYEGASAPAFDEQQAEYDENGVRVRFYAGSNPPDWARDAQLRADRQRADSIRPMNENTRRMNEETQRRNQRMHEDIHRRNMDQLHRSNAEMHRNIHTNNMRHMQQVQQSNMRAQQQQQSMFTQQRIQQQNTFRPPMH
jgi:hypothetical protein